MDGIGQLLLTLNVPSLVLCAGVHPCTSWRVILLRIFIPTIIYALAVLTNLTPVCSPGQYPNFTVTDIGNTSSDTRNTAGVKEMTWNGLHGHKASSSSSASYVWFTGGGSFSDSERAPDGSSADTIVTRKDLKGSLRFASLSSNFLKRFKFQVRIKDAGSYRFSVKSDDGSRLLVSGHDQQVFYSRGTVSDKKTLNDKSVSSYTVKEPAGGWKLVVLNGGSHPPTQKEGVVENVRAGAALDFILDFQQGTGGYYLEIKFVARLHLALCAHTCVGCLRPALPSIGVSISPASPLM